MGYDEEDEEEGSVTDELLKFMLKQMQKSGKIDIGTATLYSSLILEESLADISDKLEAISLK